MPEARCGTTVARIPVEYSADEMPDKVLGARSYGLEVATANQLRLTALRLGNSSRRTGQSVLARWGATRWRRIGLSARRHGNEKQDSISSIGSDGGRLLLQTMPNFARGQSVADACKGTRIPRERREAPNPLYLPGVGEGS